MNLHLNGKRAFIAGASKGLGYAIADLLAQEGCRVAINGRDAKSLGQAAGRLSRGSGVEVIPMPGDIGDPQVPNELVQKTAAAFGGLDLLVTNTAGPPSGKFEAFDDTTWQQAVDLTLFSHVRLIQAALPYLKRSSCASVVTMTSYSLKQPIPNLVLSNSIRAATAGLTKSLATELGPDGIRFNSVLPGWTQTERVTELISYRAKTNGVSPADEISKLTAEIPLGRLGQPEEIANAVVFLLSPAASFITGVLLLVDGGVTKGTF